MPKFIPAPSHHQELVDPRLLRGVRNAVIAGLALVLLLPMARGHSDWLGWLPMWLVGMPAVALWSLHRFRLPFRVGKHRARSVAPVRRRKPGAQARRYGMPGPQRFSRAA